MCRGSRLQDGKSSDTSRHKPYNILPDVASIPRCHGMYCIPWRPWAQVHSWIWEFSVKKIWGCSFGIDASPREGLPVDWKLGYAGICRVWLNDVECAAAINLKAHAPRRVGLETPETAPVAAILLLCFVLINPLHIFFIVPPNDDSLQPMKFHDVSRSGNLYRQCGQYGRIDL